LEILQSFDGILSIGLFATLAGLSLMAVTFMAALLFRPGQDERSLTAGHLALGYLAIAFYCFCLGLVLTLGFDGVGDKYNSMLAVQVCDLIFTGVPLALGIAFLYIGASELILYVTGRQVRFLPRWLHKIIELSAVWMADRVLPPSAKSQKK
jgi:hypothetical protein